MCRIPRHTGICYGLVIVMTLSAAAACQEPEDAALSYKGNEFIIGFTRTADDTFDHFLELYVTTSETQTVNFNVTYSRLGNTRTYSVEPNGSREVVLPYGYNAVEYDTDDKFTNKGIYIKVEGNKTISFYAFHYWSYGAEGYLALPCNRLPINEYRYSALTYFNATEDSLNIPDFILLVGCEDSTNISVSTELEPVELNKQQTYLIDSTSDLSGVVVVSDKPIFFLAGHIGFRGSSGESRYRNHFCEQIPPTATWGSFFLVADLPGFEYLHYHNRSTGAKLRILSELKSTTVFLNCNTKPISGDQYSFDRAAEYHEITLKPNSYCTIESNRPVLVMQYSPEYSKQFYMTVLPPTDQYCSHYVFYLPPQIAWITLYVTPLDYQRNNIFVDGKTLETNWTNIYCRNNTLCGHYISLRGSRTILRVYHAAKNAKIGVIVNGESYAYPGGLCVVSVHNLGFCWMPDRHAVSSETVDIHPSKSSFPTSSVILTTGISDKSSTHCQHSSAHFLLTSAMHVLPSPTMLQLSTVYSNITLARSEVPTDVTCKPGTTGTTAIHINSDTFLTFRTPTLATMNSMSISLVQIVTTSISIPTTRASSPKQFPVAIVSVSVGVTLITITTVAVIVLVQVLRRKYRNCALHHHYSLLNGNTAMTEATDYPEITLDDIPAPENGTSIKEDGMPFSKDDHYSGTDKGGTGDTESTSSNISDYEPTATLNVSPSFQTRSLKKRQELTGEEEGKVACEVAEEVMVVLSSSKKAKLLKDDDGTGNSEGTGINACGSAAEAPLTYKPNLPNLLSFCGQRAKHNIPQEISTHSRTFGILLLEDCSGARIRAICERCRGDPVKMNMDILEEWLAGRGMQPVTWETLVKVLQDMELTTLASEIAAVKCS